MWDSVDSFPPSFQFIYTTFYNSSLCYLLSSITLMVTMILGPGTLIHPILLVSSLSWLLWWTTLILLRTLFMRWFGLIRRTSKNFFGSLVLELLTQLTDYRDICLIHRSPLVGVLCAQLIGKIWVTFFFIVDSRYWAIILDAFGCSFAFPDSPYDFLDYIFDGHPFHGEKKTLWPVFNRVTFWFLWLERNGRHFRNSSSSFSSLMGLIVSCFVLV